MKINKNNFQYYYFIILIICSILYGIYITPLCNDEIYLLIYIIIFVISILVLPWFFRDNCFGIIMGAIISPFIIGYYYSKVEYDKAMIGPSIIFRFHISSVLRYGHGKGFSQIYGYRIIGKDSIKLQMNGFGVNTNNKKWIYVIYNFKCITNLREYIPKPSESNISFIQDFAFVENDSMYTYHDYSIKQPDLVYYQTGFNVVYKAVRESINESDTTANICFTDVCGKYQAIRCKTTKYEIIPDTFLVYKNVNEEIDDRFMVCAKEINTPENWSKISDYGYIFHYDIYRKEEIETQCPQIKNYVEKFKERNKQ